jgi:hypothetical protein
MDLTLRIPDDLAARLGAPGDLTRRALEALAAEEYRAGRLARPDLRRLLGFATSDESDRFLETRGIGEATTERDRRNLDRPDSVVARFRAFRKGKTLDGLDPVALIREGRP